MYQWQRYHIFDELDHHDCHIIVFNPLTYSSVEEANQKLIQELKNNKYDLFMTPHNEDWLFIETLKEIKHIGVPTLLICFDNLIVPFIHYKIAPYFDLVWLTSKETKSLFDKIGVTSLFLPYAANPNLERSNEKCIGVGFIGTPYGSRANMINSLTRNGIPVFCHCKKKMNGQIKEELVPQNSMSLNHVFMQFLKFHQGRVVLRGALVNYFKKSARIEDNIWLHKEYIVHPSELYKYYSKYSLALSSTAARNTGVLNHPLDIVNLRNFEIPMSGGLQICRYTDEMAEYFEEDKEIILYKSNEELIDKAKYYYSQEREDTRRRMRKAARERAVSQHTWFNRFIHVFQSLGINY